MLQKDKRKLFVTSALPYANGPIHLGHLVEYIQTDIWVRFQKLKGNFVVYVCADDAHGTPIMLKAEQENTDPESLIKKVWLEHSRDFAAFLINFDCYFSTHTEENRQLSNKIYKNLLNNGLIKVKKIKQMYDNKKKMFLPDRFIKGECPKCNAKNQYGDSCEICGATYNPTDLINPISEISGSSPITKESDHHFFLLSDQRCVDFLKDWTSKDGNLQPEALNKINEWLKTDDCGKNVLTDWDISRDAPYFGFEIPNYPNKFFYVWLDAPIGYFAGLKNWCNKNNKNFDDFVSPDSCFEQIHFIGKDILYFHTLFWPAILKFSGFRTPTAVYAHGFLTINGHKMSKSKGTFITAEKYLETGLSPELLRYYYASKLNGSMEDIDLNLEDFVNKVNSNLVGKYVNIISRISGFILNIFDGKIVNQKNLTHESKLEKKINEKFDSYLNKIETGYESRNTSRVVRDLTALMDSVNTYIEENKPWVLAKKINQDFESNKEKIVYLQSFHETLSFCVHCFAKLTILIKPILPAVSAKIEKEIFNLSRPFSWDDLNNLNISSIKPIDHLISRIHIRDLSKLREKPKNA